MVLICVYRGVGVWDCLADNLGESGCFVLGEGDSATSIWILGGYR
jgi:hypothetical protein